MCNIVPAMEPKPLRVTYAVLRIAAAILEKLGEPQDGRDLAKRARVSIRALYRVMNRFHKRGWLVDRQEHIAPKRRRASRRCFGVTVEGKAMLEAILASAHHRRFTAERE